MTADPPNPRSPSTDRHLFGRVPVEIVTEDKILGRMTGTDAKVYLVLCVHKRDKASGPVWPGLPEIAAQACVSRRTAITAIAHLVEIGAIRVEKGGGRIPGTKQGLANRYFLLIRVKTRCTVDKPDKVQPRCTVFAAAETSERCKPAPLTVQNPAHTVQNPAHTVKTRCTRRRELEGEKLEGEKGKERESSRTPAGAATRARAMGPMRDGETVAHLDNGEALKAASDDQLAEAVAQLQAELSPAIAARLAQAVESDGLRETCTRDRWRPAVTKVLARRPPAAKSQVEVA